MTGFTPTTLVLACHCMYFPRHYHFTGAPSSFYSSTVIAVSISLAIDIKFIMKIFSMPVANY